MLDNINNSNTPFIIHGLLALFGAIVHALQAHRAGRVKSPIDMLALVFMSSFSGVIFTLLALNFAPDQPYLTYALAGTGGYLGIEGMSYVLELITRRIK